MKFIDRLLNTITNKKKKVNGIQQQDNVTNSHIESNSNTTLPSSYYNKRFASLKNTLTIKRKRSPAISKSTALEPTRDIQQELLLTQCIETALYLPKRCTEEEEVIITHNETKKRLIDYNRRTISFDGEYQQVPPPSPLDRKLSLPHQLEPIPEVDSQIN